MNDDRLIETAREVIHTEAEAVAALAGRLDDTFAGACRHILEQVGHQVVVTGMGKSGHVARKLAATLASTGTPAFFVHPGEASHGDLGMIREGDTVLALSNSGETEELVRLLPGMKRLGITLIAMTGKPGSTLAAHADYHLHTGVDREACPLGLAPTASTAAQLAMGDAMAVALLAARGFTADDFARAHPGGALGRRLLVHIRDIMHTGDAVPSVPRGARFREALVEMTTKGLGMTAVLDDAGRVCGIFTDGDLRRTLDRDLDLRETAIETVMTPDCVTVEGEMLAAEALALMQARSINALLVVDAGHRPTGAINMHTLLRAGVV